MFPNPVHRFTEVNYIEFYKKIVQEAGAECEIIFANDPKAILKYTKNVINCDIHTRKRTKKLLQDLGAQKVCSLEDILNSLVFVERQLCRIGRNIGDFERIGYFTHIFYRQVVDKDACL